MKVDGSLKLASRKEQAAATLFGGQMKIQSIKSQDRRDFWAVYECEHCGHTQEDYGRDDEYFHNKVIPSLKCWKCGRRTNESKS